MSRSSQPENAASFVSRVALVIATERRTGGKEWVVENLADELLGLGIEPLVISLAGRDGGTTAGGAKAVGLASRAGRDLWAVRRLRGELATFDPQVIHVHDRSSLPYVWLANRFRQPAAVVFTGHGMLLGDGSPGWIERRAMGCVRTVTAVCPQAAGEYSRLFGRESVEVIANGVRPAATEPRWRDRKRAELGIADDHFVFLAVGNVNPEKGYEDLLDAAAAMVRGGDDRMRVLVAGALTNRGYADEVLARSRRLGLDGRVAFLGFRSDVRQLRAAADAFVMPSRKEAMPMALLESMSAGLAAVATDVGQVGFVLADGRAGLLAPPRQPGELAQAMTRLRRDEVLRRQLARAGRERVDNEFGAERMARRYAEVYARSAARIAAVRQTANRGGSTCPTDPRPPPLSQGATFCIYEKVPGKAPNSKLDDERSLFSLPFGAFSGRILRYVRHCFHLGKILIVFHLQRCKRLQGKRGDNARARVVMLGPLPPPTGGMASVVEALASSDLARRCELRVINNGKTTSADRPWWLGVRAQFRLLADVRRAVRDIDAQLVHLHTCSGFTFWRDCLHMALARAMGRATVWHIHGGYFDRFSAGLGKLRRAIMRRALHGAAAVIVLSDGWRERLAPLAPRANWQVVANGMAAQPADGDAGWLADPATFAFLGNLGADKGVGDLVAAALRTGFGGKVVLAGRETAPGQADALTRRIEQAGASGRIKLAGTVVGPDKERLLRSCRALVLPSRFEALPIAILEAMAFGRPVIATAVGSIPEVVRNGKEGFLVQPGDVETLAERMQQLADEPELARRMGEAARRRIDEGYSLERMVERLEEIYRGIGRAFEKPTTEARRHRENIIF